MIYARLGGPVPAKLPQHVAIKDVLPLSPTDFQVMLALAAAPLHGYAIMKSVARASGNRVRIGLGSMYRIIARLTSAGLIEPAAPVDYRPRAGKKRRAYHLTSLGRAVARAEAERLRDVLAQARSENLLSDRKVTP